MTRRLLLDPPKTIAEGKTREEEDDEDDNIKTQQQEEEEESIFIWDYVNIFTKAGWKAVDHIHCPLSTEQVHNHAQLISEKKPWYLSRSNQTMEMVKLLLKKQQLLILILLH